MASSLFVYTLWILIFPMMAWAQDDAQKALAEMESLPFSDNPFFAKLVGNSGQFEGNGTEGGEAVWFGYGCQWVGNLNCTDFEFQCEGGGVVDCTGECPGDEETLKTMLAMIQNETLAEKYPVMAKFKSKSDGNQDGLTKILQGCGFEKLLALISSFSANAGGFGNQEETEITHVDESAISGFGGDYEYDYDYDYEDEEEEKLNQDQEARDDDHLEDLEADDKQEEIHLPDRKQRSVENITIKHDMTPISITNQPNSNVIHIGKTELAKDVKNLNRYPKRDLHSYSTTQKPLGNSTKAASISLASTIPTTIASPSRKVMAGSKRGKLARKRRDVITELKKEVADLRKMFMEGVELALWNKKPTANTSERIKRAVQEENEFVSSLADQMKDMDEGLIRQIRAVTNDMKVEPMMEDYSNEKCKVQNLTCVQFPTRGQCQGVSFGGCASRVKYLYEMLSPRVMLFILISVAGLSLAVLFIGYYWFFLRIVTAPTSSQPVQLQASHWQHSGAPAYLERGTG